jgi:hypothetical protein
MACANRPAKEGDAMELNTVLTHGLTYLAALALPLWLLGEQIATWLVLRKTDAVKTEATEPKPKRPVAGVPIEKAA